MADSAAEKTEQATPKRLEDAKKKGQVLRSKELSTLTSLMASGAALIVLGPMLIESIKIMLISSLEFSLSDITETLVMQQNLSRASVDMLLAAMPFLLLVALVALVSPAMLGGWIFSADSLVPKFERLDPLKGLAKMVSVKSLVELLKAFGKFLLVATLTIGILSFVLPDIISLPLMETEYAMTRSGQLFLWCYLGFSSALILITMIDVPFQIWDFQQQMMMTKQEVRDEMKESEGRPEVKSAIRQKQQEVSQRRMMEEVPKADVIITNPTHYAVALKYDQQGGRAPIVLAKGKDLVAAKIREIAKTNGIEVFAAPPLARALYASTDLNQEIPENLFVAVAQVLAYIYQLRQAFKAQRDHPVPPQNLPVPPEYDLGRNH